MRFTGVKVTIPLHVKVSINEFTKNEMSSPALIKNVQEEIEEVLQKKAEKVVVKLQKANCDFLEIGREVAAYHPIYGKGLNGDRIIKTSRLIRKYKWKLSIVELLINKSHAKSMAFLSEKILVYKIMKKGIVFIY